VSIPSAETNPVGDRCDSGKQTGATRIGEKKFGERKGYHADDRKPFNCVPAFDLNPVKRTLREKRYDSPAHDDNQQNDHIEAEQNCSMRKVHCKTKEIQMHEEICHPEYRNYREKKQVSP